MPLLQLVLSEEKPLGTAKVLGASVVGLLRLKQSKMSSGQKASGCNDGVEDLHPDEPSRGAQRAWEMAAPVLKCCRG